MGKREFLKKILLYGLYVVASCVLIYPVIKFISFRKPQKTRIIFYADEQGAAVTFKEGVFLLLKGNEASALSARCTHLGCTLSFDPLSNRFQCPCHGSRFDINGKRVAGPARKDLERIPITRNENGDIVVTLTL
jgi:cytochrome b6-f complex iron-sulfur subunit